MLPRFQCSKCLVVCESLCDGVPVRPENAVMLYEDAPASIIRTFVDIEEVDGTIRFTVKSKFVKSRDDFAHLAYHAYTNLCKHDWNPV